jgi:serine/threonine-protein kinase HipA
MKNNKNKNPEYQLLSGLVSRKSSIRYHSPEKLCLKCYKPLGDEYTKYYHDTCSKKFFGQVDVPKLGYKKEDLTSLTQQYLKSHTGVSGVQPKISLSWNRKNEDNPVKKLTIVGMYGDYILKSPSEHYRCLPELEDCTMNMADVCGLKTVPHTLFYLEDDTMCYLTKRVDRVKKQMRHMEDMCQLTERLTEDKYKGSHEQVAKCILKYSSTPMLDVGNFYEYVIFCFLTGNADMHLKNFSLLEGNERDTYTLSPAYDLLSTSLVNPEDEKELALTLNAKKNKITYADFLAAYTSSKLLKRVLDKAIENFYYCHLEMIETIYSSFLPIDMKEDFEKLLRKRLDRLISK